MNEKLLFLLNSSNLYKNFISLTGNDCLRRFLAFKIIMNCMSFEDLINNRQFSNVRPIRDIFLAHKQENDFFNAFNASNVITNNLIEQLIEFMENNSSLEENIFPEMEDEELKEDILNITKNILKKFEEDYFSGYRLSNNFLCTQRDQISEISSGPIASVFYRYNSSKQLSFLSNYFISNVVDVPKMDFVLHNAKIDYVLHAVNMHDCIFKDGFNMHSIDGLHEVLLAESIGDISALDHVQQDSSFLDIYHQLRLVRNKLAGHMDRTASLSDLLSLVDDLNFDDVFDFVNRLDKAVFDTAQTHIAIRVHNLPNQPKALNIDNSNIIQIKGLQNEPYFN